MTNPEQRESDDAAAFRFGVAMGVDWDQLRWPDEDIAAIARMIDHPPPSRLRRVLRWVRGRRR